MVVGCEDDPLIEKAEDELFGVRGATLAATNVSGNEYNIVATEMVPVTFDVTTNGEAVSSANMYVSYNGGAPVLVSSINSFPSAQSFTMDGAAAAAGVTSGLAPGDTFTFSFGEVVTSSGEYKTGSTVSVLVVTAFDSALAGVYTCVTTVTNQGAGIDWDACEGNTWEGTVEYVRNHVNADDDGNYTILTTAASGEQFDDVSHGSYYACYGTDAQGNLPNNGMADGGDLRVIDVDGVLSFTGASQWGEVWSIDALAVDGATLTMTLTNDYGEGGISVLTRTDGTEWPELSN
jgi:hypothetical protein